MNDSELLRSALTALGIRNFVFSIHDPSFPSRPEEDIGRGTPYSRGAQELVQFVHGLGFNGLQLGPQGLTSEGNPSPYDGTLFSRNILNAYLPELCDARWSRLLELEHVVDVSRVRPDGSDRRAAHRPVYPLVRTALRLACMNLLRGKGAQDERRDVMAEFSAFTGSNAGWLEPDAMYEALCEDHAVPHWKQWPDALDRELFAPARMEDVPRAAKRRQDVAVRHALFVEYAFSQFVVHVQHRNFRERLRPLGIKLYGDLQVGRSAQDVWSQQSSFLRGYLMGAPPSRTNPDGQHWGYPVMDPRLYFGPEGKPGPALVQVSARMRKLFAEYDGIRIDHPHGLVCPWVYRDLPGETGEGLAAVRAGARLFDSPDLPDHPELGPLAIARPEQLERSLPRYADGWVRALEDAQVERYAVLMEVIASACREHGHDIRDLLCEVLSTLPYPLQRVLERFGLGRFRVTQKADLDAPEDVYRSENAQRPDWMMVGNHDTKPIWRVADDWAQAGKLGHHAQYLAERLVPDPANREAFVKVFSATPQLLAQAKCAELFSSKAQNALVFFTDLFGMKEHYNAPGVVSDDNWSLRVPPSYAGDYAQALKEDKAMNLPWAMSMALRAKGGGDALAERLEEFAVRLRGGKKLPYPPRNSK